MSQNGSNGKSAGPQDAAIILRWKDGAWPLIKKNLLRQAGVKVEDVAGQPDRIAVTGLPRNGRSFADVIGSDRKFERLSPSLGLAPNPPS